MIIKILEPRPHIIPEYLSYVIDKGHTLIEYDTNYDQSLIEGIIIRSQIKADKMLIDQYPSLKMICRVGVGLDGVDLEYCKEKGITVYNTPGANATAVADLVIWGILTLSRKLFNIDCDRQKRYSYEGNELHSQKVGILGFGNIGKKVYQRLVGFGVHSFAIYDPYLTAEQVSAFPGCTLYNTIEEFIGDIDILSLHLPLTVETKNLFNAVNLEKFKPSIKLINTSRGGIIHEEDLLHFLQQNPQAGVLLDVWEGEPELTDIIKKLQLLPNCIVTPHIGAMTIEATKAMHTFTI